jgi:hypothetical protein
MLISPTTGQARLRLSDPKSRAAWPARAVQCRPHSACKADNKHTIQPEKLSLLGKLPGRHSQQQASSDCKPANSQGGRVPRRPASRREVGRQMPPSLVTYVLLSAVPDPVLPVPAGVRE